MTEGSQHIARLCHVLPGLEVEKLRGWGGRLAAVLAAGGRLLAAGNGGSAAEVQHLTAELVGRMRDERRPLSAIALHAEGPAVTAIGNDYGYAETFARQVTAHGRLGDVLILLSASGRSANVRRAAEAGRAAGLTVWALTGRAPNPLSDVADDSFAVPETDTAIVQECHLVAIHLLCSYVESSLNTASPPRPLVVVGDTMLDRDLSGVVERLSPDGPVPVVDDVTASTRPGGAGLTALLARRHDRPVLLVSAFSDDRSGTDLKGMLTRSGVGVIDLGLNGPTPVKTRVRCAGRTLLAFSEGDVPGRSVRRQLSTEDRTVLRSAAAVAVADYGRGVTAASSIRSVLREVAGRIPVVWDPHPRGADPVPGVRLVTPNVREARRLAPDITGSGLSADMDRARLLTTAWPGAAVAVTRGPDGAVLADAEGSSVLAVPSAAVAGADSCGAGDCFTSAAAVRLADGALLSEAVTSAVEAAGRYVAAGGASTVRTGYSSGPEKPDDAGGVIERIRQQNGIIVATGGCFDLLHAGHIAVLENARRLGDCLIVCLNDDDSVRRLKGPDRPVVPVADRAKVLGALAPVDAVVVFAEDTPDETLRRIRPQLWVKGGDYRVGDLPEAKVLAEWGGQAVILPYLANRSTTSLIDRITAVRSN